MGRTDRSSSSSGTSGCIHHAAKCEAHKERRLSSRNRGPNSTAPAVHGAGVPSACNSQIRGGIAVVPPTDEQRGVINSPSAVFVHACPGAGKTETIVGRVSALISSIAPRRGLAVLSFTNAALEEFTRRCADVSLERVLRHPHYVGTFDAFVRHFLVLPGGIPGCDVRPNIVDSWRTLGVDVRL